jgi:threonyl-tRNA synthetase
MEKKQKTIFDLRSTAAALLFLALKQRFPSALLVESKVTPLGFYCDFSLSSPFGEGNLKQVEEVMQAWIRQKIEVQVREMVGKSAREYFLFHKEPHLARFVENSNEQVFFLLQMAGQMVLSESSSSLCDLGQIEAFCLQKFDQVDSKLRVYGTAFFDKKELKDFLKKAKDWTLSSHVTLGEKLGLFEESEGEWLWLPEGYKALSLLKNCLESEIRSQGFSSVSSTLLSEDSAWNAFSERHAIIFEKQKTTKVFKVSESTTFCSLDDKDPSLGLLDPHVFQGIRSHVFCSKKDLFHELISSLHFMTKIFKILGFTFDPVLFEVRKGKFKDISSLFFKALKGLGGDPQLDIADDGIPRIQLDVVDGLGRSWPIAYISAALTLKEEVTSFASSICLSFERVFALLLEKEGGYLPFLISPLQVKVVPLQEKHCSFAKEILDSLKREGYRAEFCFESKELKVALRQALESGVPYVLVIGDKELETNTITLRDVRAKKAQSLSWQELLEVLR